MPHTFTRADVTLGNWRQRPYSAWSFHNAVEIVPSAIIPGNRRPEQPAPGLGDLGRHMVDLPGGGTETVARLLEQGEADTLVVMRDGSITHEWYSNWCDTSKPHLIFSITKSVTGLLAGFLVERGLITYDTTAGDVVPAVRGSAFADATLAHLLDMQVSVDFVDDYLDTTGPFDRYRRAMLWNPERDGVPKESMLQVLATIARAGHDHGTRHAYHSINTDMAGIMLETVAGRRFGDMVGEWLWRPAGAHSDAHVTLDRAGAPRAAGGMSATARDLARLGEMLRLGRDLPASLVDRVYAGGDPAIWAAGDQGALFARGSYRNAIYHDGRGAIAGIGIHGQWLWIDRATRTVIVRLASESLPFTAETDATSIALMRAIAAA